VATNSIFLQSTSFQSGGAAIAAKRWSDALGPSTFKLSMDTDRNSLMSKLINRSLSRFFWNASLEAIIGPMSFPLAGQQKQVRGKFLFTHWVQNGFISLRQLAKQAPNTIWYAHDEWLTCGLGHYNLGPTFQQRMPRRTQILNLLAMHWKRRRILYELQGVCVPSNWMRQNLIEAGLKGEKIAVIPNPVPLSFFQNRSKQISREFLHLDSHVNVVLTIASASKNDYRKGVDLITPTLSELQKKGLPIVFISVGIRGFSVDIGGIKHIAFDSIDDENMLINLYRASDVVLIPSRIDNFPQVITEAQSLGVPVVAFNVGGIPEGILIPGVSGKLVTTFSTVALADATSEFLTNNRIDEKLSRSMTVLAKEKWSNEKVASSFREFLLTLSKNC